MIGEVTVHGATYPIYDAELHLPVVDGSRYLYLMVYVGRGAERCGFALWEIELPLLKSFDALDGQRIHVAPTGESYDDDTLGTDIIGMSDVSGWGVGTENASYGDIRIDFQRVRGNEYRCVMECTLTDEDLDDEPKPEDFDVVARAEFTVLVDERDPYADTR